MIIIVIEIWLVVLCLTFNWLIYSFDNNLLSVFYISVGVLVAGARVGNEMNPHSWSLSLSLTLSLINNKSLKEKKKEKEMARLHFS